MRPTGVEILNDVVLNQVLVRFTPPGGGDADAFTRAVIARVQAGGDAWLGGTTWHGMGSHAHQRQQLVHDGGRYRPDRRGDPAGDALHNMTKRHFSAAENSG